MGSSQPYRRGENAIAKRMPKATPPVSLSSQGHEQDQLGGKKEQDADLEWDGDFVSADTDESHTTPVSGGITVSGTNSDGNEKRTSENDVKVVSPQKYCKPGVVEKENGGKISNDATTKESGIGVKPAVRSQNSTTNLNSKTPDSISTSRQVPAATTTTTSKTNVLSNSVSVKETAPAETVTSNSARIENPVEAKDDGTGEGQGSTKVTEDSIEDLDEFDIDKFLEELDFDT